MMKKCVPQIFFDQNSSIRTVAWCIIKNDDFAVAGRLTRLPVVVTALSATAV
jgi:hypothetical protein